MSIKKLAPMLLFVAILFLPSIRGLVSAQAYPRLANRSLTLGTTEPGVATEYIFSWSWPSNTSVGSVRLTLCADAYVLDPCSSVPPGDFSGAVLDSQSGSLGGFSISSQTANEIVISRGASGGSGTGQYSFTFSNVINPSGIHNRFFVQLASYTATNATGTPTHRASVASATAEPIMINTRVPPILYFCAGLSITEWCEEVNGNYIDYGELAPYVTDYATSQFGVSTNAEGGYVVTINGHTMAAGNKLITPMETLAPNSPGIGQFGLNLRANTDPPAGADVVGDGTGVVDPDYDIPDMFLFRDGDEVARAETGTMFNTFTVTYIVNIDPDQPSGIYNTTIAYICTAAF